MYASSADLDVVDDGDASIYNGDENHKVWSGSTDQLNGIAASSLEGPYDIYSGTSSTLGRPARQRQISAPVPVPPPPKEEVKQRGGSSNKGHKDKSSKRHSLGSSQSLSGTLIRPKPVHASSMTLNRHLMHMPPIYQNGGGGGGGPPPGMIYGPPQRQFHTLGRPTNGGGPHGPPFHHMMPMPPPPPPHPHSGMPHMMMPAQYATLQAPRSKSKGSKHSKKDKHNGHMGMGPPLGIPVPTPMFAYPPPAQMMMPADARPLAMSSRKLAQSAAAGLDESGNSGAESPGGTGIYRRKGHLNERAFSYSIRQEHRSRSHGSLASLQFNPPDMKKEREIAQMVSGLDLNDGPSTLQRRTSGMTNGGGGGMHSHMNGNGGSTHHLNGGGGGGGSSSGTYGKPRM